MASQTILIESNRQLSYLSQEKDLEDKNTSETGIKTLPTNKWNTFIKSGIELNEGDKVSLQSVMLNTLGNPDESIEFMGDEGIGESYDNNSTVTLDYYINNNQMYNCNLPLAGTTINLGNARSADFGAINLSTFADFTAAFPYRSIRGVYYNTGSSEYLPVEGIPVVQNSMMYYTSVDRLYLGSLAFGGYDSDTITPYETRTQDVKIEIEKGFNSPSSVSDRITSILHQKQGGFTQPKIYGRDGTVISSTEQYDFSTICYKAVPTCHGDIMDGYGGPSWPITIEGDGSPQAGTGYTEEKGKAMFYTNLLCGNPEYYSAVGDWLSMRQNNWYADSATNFESRGLLNGFSNELVGIGNLGLNPVLLDEMESVALTSDVIHATGRTSSISIPNMLCMITSSAQTLLTTNLPYNENCISKIAQAFRKTEYPYLTSTLTPTQSSSFGDLVVDLCFGRTNDNLTLGISNSKVCIPNSHNHITTPLPATLPNSYITTTGGNEVYAGRSECRGFSSRHELTFCSEFTKNITDVCSLPVATNFSKTNTKGERYSTALSEQYNVAIVPVFYRQSEAPHADLLDKPFCAFVIRNAVGATAIPGGYIPLPTIGEYFGYSPSFQDNFLSKIVSTQKVGIPSAEADGLPTYPDQTEVNERTYSYFPYIYIGADDPSINFDTSKSKMTISGLHTGIYPSNGSFAEPLAQENETADQESILVQGKQALICGIDTAGTISAPVNTNQALDEIISAQSGVALNAISILTKSGSKTLSPYQPFTYKGCLWDKLGFNIEQLMPYYGKVQNIFNRDDIVKMLGNNVLYDKYFLTPKPITTNGYWSSAENFDSVQNVGGQPMYQLGGIANNQQNYVSAESDAIIAQNLPTKMEYSHLVVYSDIVRNTRYYNSNGQRLPAIGYLSRNYTTGDYIFSSNTSPDYFITNPYILTDINTDIRLPNGQAATFLTDNSTVIYSIEKPL